MKAIAKALKAENKNTNTQAVVARKLGVARETVRDWFMPNGGTAIANARKINVKVNPKESPVILSQTPLLPSHTCRPVRVAVCNSPHLPTSNQLMGKSRVSRESSRILPTRYRSNACPS